MQSLEYLKPNRKSRHGTHSHILNLSFMHEQRMPVLPFAQAYKVMRARQRSKATRNENLNKSAPASTVSVACLLET
jgi:hypothetical protein